MINVKQILTQNKAKKKLILTLFNDSNNCAQCCIFAKLIQCENKLF